MTTLLLLLLPALVWAQGPDQVTTPPIVFDSAAVSSCVSRKAVTGAVSYCDQLGAIVRVGSVNEDATCGDGQINPELGELCDGSAALGSCIETGCSAQCRCAEPTTTTVSGSTTTTTVLMPEPANCGNGTREYGEACDAGGDACTTDADCGQTGDCVSSFCAAAVDTSCTHGCTDCACAAPPSCTGDTIYYVRSDGNDSTGDGTANTAAKAWLTVQHALDTISLSAGVNTICLGDGGTFTEQVVIPSTLTPTAANSLKIQSATGATLDGTTGLESSGWTAYATIASGVYRKRIQYGTNLDTPKYATLNGRYVPGVFPRGGTTPNSDVDAVLTNGPDDCSTWSSCTRAWTVSDFVWGVRDDGYTYVRLEDRSDPNGQAMRFGQKWTVASDDSWVATAALRTNGKSYITIDGLTITGAKRLVSIQAGSTNVTISRNTFTSWENAVVIEGGTSNITVTQNTFDGNIYTKAGIDVSGYSAEHWSLWKWFKNYFPDEQDRNGVRLDPESTGTSNRIQTVSITSNVFTTGFQGVSHYDVTGDGWTITGNTFRDLLDEGIDFQMQQHPVTNVRINTNTFEDCNVALRTNLPGGPVWVHQNIAFFNEGTYAANAEGYLVYHTAATSAYHYIYNNSFSGPSCFVLDLSVAGTLPNVVAVNNACSTARSIYRKGATATYAAANFDYNWWRYAPATDAYTGTLGTNNRLGTARIWPTTSLPTFEPPSETGSGANVLRGKGEDVTTYGWTITAVAGRAYANPPDIGALQYLAQGTTTTTTTTIGATTTTTILAIDWSGFVDVILLMESSPPITDTGVAACPDFTNNNTIGTSATAQEGLQAAFPDRTANESLSSTCATLNYSVSFVCGGWLRPTVQDPGATGSWINRLPTTRGYQGTWNGGIFRSDTWNGSDARCRITQRSDGTNTTVPLNSWGHAAFTFDDEDNAQSLYVNGVRQKVDCSEAACSGGGSNQDSCPQTGIGTGSATFYVGGDDLSGQIDEVFCDEWESSSASDGKIDPTSLCRIWACGIAGTGGGNGGCTCSGTAYVTSGRWTAGACTLPACNQAQP